MCTPHDIELARERTTERECYIGPHLKDADILYVGDLPDGGRWPGNVGGPFTALMQNNVMGATFDCRSYALPGDEVRPWPRGDERNWQYEERLRRAF